MVEVSRDWTEPVRRGLRCWSSYEHGSFFREGAASSPWCGKRIAGYALCLGQALHVGIGSRHSSPIASTAGTRRERLPWYGRLEGIWFLRHPPLQAVASWC